MDGNTNQHTITLINLRKRKLFWKWLCLQTRKLQVKTCEYYTNGANSEVTGDIWVRLGHAEEAILPINNAMKE